MGFGIANGSGPVGQMMGGKGMKGGQMGGPRGGMLYGDVVVRQRNVDAAAAVGVTGITKLVLLPTARPAGIVQVTVWPAAVHPPGNVPKVRPLGIGSVIVLAAVVAAVPVLLTCSV